MCGRFTSHLPIEFLANYFGVPALQELHPRFNIAPTQQVLVVRTIEDGSRHFAFLRWGLVPSWAKDPFIGSRMINARSETVDVKPAFRNALKHRRCVVPANGFYEWEEVGGSKKPLYVKMKDSSPMILAGLWDHWKSTEGELIESCTILTTNSNELIKPLHDRMPVILDIKDVDLWLDPLVSDPEKLKHLFNPCSPEKLEMYPVSDIVNTPRNDIPECIIPLPEPYRDNGDNL